MPRRWIAPVLGPAPSPQRRARLGGANDRRPGAPRRPVRVRDVCRQPRAPNFVSWRRSRAPRARQMRRWDPRMSAPPSAPRPRDAPTAPLPDRRVDKFRNLDSEALPGELFRMPADRGGIERRRLRRADPRHQGVRRLFGEEDSGHPGRDTLQRATAPIRDHRASACLCLDWDETEILLSRKYESPALSVIATHRRIAKLTHEAHVRARHRLEPAAFRAVAHDHERPVEAIERLYRHVDALVGHEARDNKVEILRLARRRKEVNVNGRIDHRGLTAIVTPHS